MRRLTHTLAGFLALAGSLVAQTTFYVGLPASMDEATRNAVWSSLFQLVDGAEPGDLIEVIDAWDLVSVRTLTVPDAKPGTARHRRLRRDIGPIAQFLKRAKDREPGAEGRNAILHPQFLAMVGSAQEPEQKARCILMGSIFYRSPKDAPYAMGGGLYPSDGHLASKGSIYSCVGKEALLKGCPVYFCYLDEAAFSSTPERTSTRQWWAKYVASCGSTLAHASASAPSMIKAALRGDARPAEPGATVDRGDTRVAMLRAGAKTRVDVEPVSAPAALVEAARVIALPKKGFVRLYLLWGTGTENCDMDFWVKASPSAEEIYFQNKETPEGRLLRDVVRSKPIGDASEWHGTWEVVELKEAAIRDTSCYLNLFKNIGGAEIDGLVRIVYADRTADIPFTFKGEGNKAGARDARDTSPHWKKIDVTGALTAAAR